MRYESQHTPFLAVESHWTDSVILEMTLEEKLGQLVMVQTSLTEGVTEDSLLRWASKGQLSGIFLQDITADRFLRVQDTLNSIAKLPLIWGTREQINLHKQFSDLYPYPASASIGAIGSDSLISAFSNQVVEQYHHFGINLVLGSRVVIPDSIYAPEILYPNQQKHQAYMLNHLARLKLDNILMTPQGFKEYLIAPNDTLGLIQSALSPYQKLVKSGVSGILVDSSITRLDTLDQLNRHFLKHYLRRHLQFEGLIFGEVQSGVDIEELLHVGVDVLILPNHVSNAIEHLRCMNDEGLLPESVINERVAKVLQAKRWIQEKILLPEQESTIGPDWLAEMKGYQHKYEVKKLYQQGMILAHNPDGLIPLSNLSDRRIKHIHFGDQPLFSFREMAKQYVDFTTSLYSFSEKDYQRLVKKGRYARRTVIFTIEDSPLEASEHRSLVETINEWGGKTEVVVVNFGNPNYLSLIDTTIAIIQLMEQNKVTEELAAQLIFGGTQAPGHLPRNLANHLCAGQQILTPISRLEYVLPEEAGIAPYKLVGIDAIMEQEIKRGSFPGGQVMVIKSGKVIYDKAFGYHTPKRKQQVSKYDLYDLASITKVAGTSLTAMKAYEDEKIKIKSPLKKYIPLEDNKKLGSVTLQKLMTHRSFLQPNMPIVDYILWKKETPENRKKYFCETEECEDKKGIPVAEGMYLRPHWLDSMMLEVYDLEPQRRRGRKLRYSDVNFVLMQQVLEKQYQKDLDEMVDEFFAEPLNLRSLTYNPLEQFQKGQIVPTAEDARWRQQRLQGYVHDESAALLGGVAGNAGLFGNANDLGILFQMLLNGGHYGGDTLLQRSTIDYFTSSKHGGTRGLGFMKPRREKSKHVSRKASIETYGHTGFTGTSVWLDPQEELIFILLTNRVYTSVNNKKMYSKVVRSRIHDVIYDALDTYPDDHPLRNSVAELGVLKATVEE